MLGSELFIGCIDYFKALRRNRRMQSLNRRDGVAIQLEDILYELDFGYDIINGELKLVDLLGVNRCNTESQRFKINENLASAVLYILGDYLQDYILVPIIKDLTFSMGVRPTHLYCAKDILRCMQDYSYIFTNKQFIILEAIIDPTKIRIDNVIRNIKRSN